MNQIEINFLGRLAKEQGIQQAEDHAGDEWNAKAWKALLSFLIMHGDPFMTEDVRRFAYNRGLPSPPSERAWGAIILKAVRQNLVIAIGMAKVTNVKAHQANAALWQRR